MIEKRKVNKTKVVVGITIFSLILLTMGLAVSIFLLYTYYNKFGTPYIDKSNVVNYITKIASVPSNEIPLLAEIVDPSNLQNQNNLIFSDSQKGDLIIVYKEKTILFRLGVNKVIEEINLKQN